MEVPPVVLDDGRAVLDADTEKIGVAERQAAFRGEQRRVDAGTEQPDFGCGVRGGRAGFHAWKRMGGVGLVVQIVHDMIHLLGKVLDVAHRPGIGQRRRGALIAARGAADPQIDPAGIERLQHPKRLGHFERTIVRQHDPAAADPNRVGRRGDLADHDFGTRAGETGQAVMFGDPIAPIPQRFGGLCQLDGLAQRLARGAALPNRGLIHDAQCQPRRHAFTLQTCFWHCGQKCVLRWPIRTRSIGVRQRRHGLPVRPYTRNQR